MTFTGPFADDFSDDFDIGGVRLVTLHPLGFLDLADTPRPPEYSPLWRRYQFPVTPTALLLWKDGRVKEVCSLYDEGFLSCDAVIANGPAWFTTEDSWQAQVLTAAGYTLVDYEGPRP